ncbi:13004_t:CDS:2, partial [Cetraspora pellucida]
QSRISDESTSNSDEEISDNNLEPKISNTLRGNHRGRGQPRLTRTNRGASNSRSRRDSCSTGGSMVSHEEIDVAVSGHDMLLEQQEEDVNTLVIDLTSQDPDPEIERQLNTYLDLNNSHILTEEKLEDSEIIEIVLDEANQHENGDPDDTDEEEPEISVSEGLKSLNTFIGFFEQQADTDFKAEDLKIFRKYLPLVNQKYIESKWQTSISDFFKPLDNEEDWKI